ncbi:MAG: RdgB/HAM1 family non-canonical purine NTP pyrophosphatase [Chloroflexota bacterium]
MSTPNLLVATNNRGKAEEIAALLDGLPVKVVRPIDLGLSLDVAETGSSYAENARLKARAFAARSGRLSLADDSGLEIKVLGGWPGLYSSRFAGPTASDLERQQMVLDRLAGRPESERQARFVCHVALAGPRGVLAEAEGVVEGTIALARSGIGGFGFDPIFVPAGFDRTFGELPAELKREISHRARAIAKIRPAIERLVRSP